MPAAVPDPGAAPTLESVLDTLTQPRLLDLARLFGSDIREPSTTKDRLVRRLGGQLRGGLPALLRELGRDELRVACRRHALPDQARARVDLQGQLLQAAGIDPKSATVRPPLATSQRASRAGPSRRGKAKAVARRGRQIWRTRGIRSRELRVPRR